MAQDEIAKASGILSDTKNMTKGKRPPSTITNYLRLFGFDK
jgi:hypothetical protein